MRLKSKTFIFSVMIFLPAFITVITLSCVPEGGPHNPAEYELDISISADKYPVISPDGSRIAYYHKCLKSNDAQDYPTGLYIMDIDGTNRKLIIEGEHWTPSWSPDGQWLVFTSNGTIQIINNKGEGIRTFQGINDVPLFFPDWSPDGKMILMNSPYVDGGGVFISDPQFKNVRQMFNQIQLSGFSAQWSPNMDRIIYEKVSHDWDGGEVFIMDTLGINDSRITKDNLDDTNPRLSNNNKITWSRNVRIMVMNVDGTNQKTFDYGQYPSWSPISDYIIYSNANDDFTKEVLWKINIDGSNKTQLTY